MKNKTYRTNGAVGALLDEYERSIHQLNDVIAPITQAKLTYIVDSETKDDDCRSIQTILTHVVHAGYNYAVYIHNHQKNKEDIPYFKREVLDSTEAYQREIETMFAYTVQVFDQFPNLQLESHHDELKIKTSWGQKFDVEQLMEHAIVHILRHRRQIERFLIKLENI